MQPIPAPSLVLVEAAFPLGILVELLDRPATVGQLHQALQRRVSGQGAEVVLGLACVARKRALAEEPAFGSGADAAVRGTLTRAARGPVRPHRSHLLLAHALGAFPPPDGLPGVLRQCCQHGGRAAAGGRARFLGLAVSPPHRERRHRASGSGGTALASAAAARSSSGSRIPKVLSTAQTYGMVRCSSAARKLGASP
jgi:hypothetical protein